MAAVGAADEGAEHLFRNVGVRDGAVFHRTQGVDDAWRAAEHALRFLADGDYFARLVVDGHDGRLVDYDAHAGDIDDRVGGAEVNADVACKSAQEFTRDVQEGIAHSGTEGSVFHSLLLKKRPVTLIGSLATSVGVPQERRNPPAAPPSGPRSMM